MITFDSLVLKAFVNEQIDLLQGARINKIQQPTRREFIFNLRCNGETKQLYININPQFYHVCFMSKENAEKRFIEIPQKPPMFCMLLRKYIENSRIEKVNVVENERILEFYIETYNEIGEKIFLCLAIEFMGKHSNIILYNYDTNIILGCAHNVGADKSRQREIYGSLPYVYPPKQNKINILQYNGEIDFNTMSDDFYMVSSTFAQSCKDKSLEQVKSYIRLENISPTISRDFSEYSLFVELLPNSKCVKSVNEMIDEYYAHYIEINKFELLKSKYKVLVNQKLKKTKHSLKQMSEKLNQDYKSDKYRLYGDLLMANLYNLKDYSSLVEVYDYENNKYININLDNLKTIKENANNFYKKYNKSKTSINKLTTLTEDLKLSKIYLEQILYSIENSVNMSDLLEISLELETEKVENKKKNKPTPLNILKLEVDDSTTIYIGKNNKQNDYIISKLASENDYWFHVHNCAGSHVLLKTNVLTDDLIMKCVRLAKEYSSVKNSSKIGVIYTQRKYIRKPPKANLGYVTYKNEKEIILD